MTTNFFFYTECLDIFNTVWMSCVCECVCLQLRSRHCCVSAPRFSAPSAGVGGAVMLIMKGQREESDVASLRDRVSLNTRHFTVKHTDIR